MSTAASDPGLPSRRSSNSSNETPALLPWSTLHHHPYYDPFTDPYSCSNGPHHTRSLSDILEERTMSQEAGSPSVTTTDNDEIIELYYTLSSQASRLLFELDEFQKHISAQSPGSDVFLARFRREVRQEANLIEERGRCIPPAIRNRYARRSAECGNIPLRSSAELLGEGSLGNGQEETEVETDERGYGICSRASEVVESAMERKGDTDRVSDDSGLRGLHRIRSSNITSYTAIWEEAKRNEGLVSLKKKVKYPALMQPSSRKRKKVLKETLTVDIIAYHGKKWIKVWTKSQYWLEMDMAKEGLVDLHGEMSTSDDEEDAGSGSSQGSLPRDWDGLDDLKLVKMAREYVAAAKTSRINHRHPKVHFILPKIYRGRSRDVDIVLGAIERLGVVVCCFGEKEAGETSILGRNIVWSFERMTTQPEPLPYSNGHMLNLDCTVLIALVSDISHFQLRSEETRDGVEIPAHYHGQSRCDIYDQFRADECRSLLTSDIYPILSGKQLMCTSVAAEHLRKIVRLMGTETEARRAEILLGGMKPDRTRAEWNKISTHVMPDTVRLPLEIVKFELADAMSDIQRQSRENSDHANLEVAQRLSKLEERQLSSLNKAVFIYGWSRRIRTFTLNRVVSGFINRTVNDVLDGIEERRVTDGFIGPVVFDGPCMEVCARERSLIGSEKTCRNK